MAVDKIIGIDVGTTSVKAAVLDTTGVVRASFSESYETRRTSTHIVEQDPDGWVQLIKKALDSFAAHNVLAVGLCSQANTHVFVGADGNALCPAISWQDGRASAEAAALDAQVTLEQKQAWWGAPMPIDASHAVSRMAWMAKHRPDIWGKTRWVMLPKDYCMFKLTGEASTDPLSNIGLVDNDLNYIAEVVDLVEGAKDRVAPLIGITDIAGRILQGPHADTPIVSGTMDAWAGLVGTGGATPKSTMYLSGTSEILGISSSKVVPTPGVIVFPSANDIRLHAGPTQNGGDAKLWFCQVTGMSMDEMSAMVAQTPRSFSTPLFLPHLEGARAPVWDAGLRGSFIGIGRQTRLPDFARAVYEGVAFSALHVLETLNVSADVDSDLISCGGGGFKSPAWTQIRADILGKPLQVLTDGEPGILGAVTLAAIGVGAFTDVTEASIAFAKFDAPYQPNMKMVGTYTSVFEIYKDAITTTADLGKRLTQSAETGHLSNSCT
jgi:xylulokinase